MAVAYTVHADSREACATALELLCAALGLTPTRLPLRPPGGDRWIARAADMPAAPVREDQGRQSG